MTQTVKLKRSSVTGNIPTTAQLELGEIAINTYDGKVFIKKNDGSEEVVEVGTSVTPTLDQVTGAGNTTASDITVGGITATGLLSSGDVGIGTTTPVGKLGVVSSDNSNSSIIAQFSRLDGNSAATIRNPFQGSSTPLLEINPDKVLLQGDVVKFHMYQSGGVSFAQSHTGATLTSPYFKFSGNYNSGGVDSAVAGSFDFTPTYASGGKFTMRVQGSEGLTVWRHENRLPIVNIGGATFTDAQLNVIPNWTGKKGIVIRAITSQTANLFEWQNSGGTGLGAIDASGNVGIGTTTPSTKLDVVGDVNVDGALTFASDGAGANWLKFYRQQSNYWRLTSSGVGTVFRIMGNNVTFDQNVTIARAGLHVEPTMASEAEP